MVTTVVPQTALVQADPVRTVTALLAVETLPCASRATTV